jgi:hypothetical protein
MATGNAYSATSAGVVTGAQSNTIALAVTGTPWTALGYLTNVTAEVISNYIPAYVLASTPTTTITRAMGELIWLTCTSAITKLTFQNTDWDTNGAGRVNVDLYGNNFSIGFDTTVITNSTLLDINTNANICTPLFFRRPSGGTIWRVRQ